MVIFGRTHPKIVELSFSFAEFLSAWKKLLYSICSFLRYMLKLIVSQERTDGINWSFASWYKFTQIKRWLKILGVSMVKNVCGQSGDGILKLTVTEEWTDRINWFFACWYMVTKIKSWSNFFWVNMVRNGHIFLVNEVLKSAVSELMMNLWIELIFWMLIVMQ